MVDRHLPDPQNNATVTGRHTKDSTWSSNFFLNVWSVPNSIAPVPESAHFISPPKTHLGLKITCPIQNNVPEFRFKLGSKAVRNRVLLSDLEPDRMCGVSKREFAFTATGLFTDLVELEHVTL